MTPRPIEQRPPIFEGLAKTATKGTGAVLTREMFENTIKYLGSEEYAKQEYERQRKYAMGEMILGEALSGGEITEAQYYHLLGNLGINGSLLVSKEMYGILEPAVERLEKKMGKS